MSIPQFTDIISLSNKEVAEEIIKSENVLFNLRFKKATRQAFKCHEIKNSRRRLAQLKTLLTLRLKDREGKEKDMLDQLIRD
jgi:large subunit ribosomal protein L29